jgi:serine/threonine protein kinase
MPTAALAPEMLATPRLARAGAADAPHNRDDTLPPGTRLHEFELQRVLGIGGFGIVYLALDHALLRQVAIKEYMPGELARRGAGVQVSLRSAAHAETFTSGLQSFLKEAQLLARFDHPALVKVHRYWEANGTAYMAMQYVAGRTLNEVRRAERLVPDEAALRRLIEPLLGALEVLHEQGVYHRDISPDNILVQPDGSPVLLDFGAARRVIGDRTQRLTAVLKPSFAPVEQYGDVPGMRQGPWTDLYALGAVMHCLLTGRDPVPAVVRAMHDHMLALSVPEPAVAGISPAFLTAIDWMLGVRPQERPPSVQALREALAGTRPPPPPTPRLPEELADDATAAREAGADVDGHAGAPAAETGVWESTVRHERAPSADVTAATVSTAPEQTPELTPERASEQARQQQPQQQSGEAAPYRRTMRRGGIAALAMAVVVGAAFWGFGMREHADTPALDLPAASTAAVAAPARPADADPAATRADSIAPSVGPHGEPAAQRPESSPKQAPATASATAVTKTAAAVVEPTTARTAHTVPRSAAIPADPREACRDRNFLAMSMCLNRRCLEPAFRAHPQCLELKAYDEKRRQAQMNR